MWLYHAQICRSLLDHERLTLKNGLIGREDVRHGEVVFVSQVSPTIDHGKRKSAVFKPGLSVSHSPLADNLRFFSVDRVLNTNQRAVRTGTDLFKEFRLTRTFMAPNVDRNVHLDAGHNVLQLFGVEDVVFIQRRDHVVRFRSALLKDMDRNRALPGR